MLDRLSENRFLFITCFVALAATSSAFIIRVMLMDQWQIAFGLSETQKGEIFGAGLWPFGLSIVIFSLVIDKIGYRQCMIFAFACHIISALLMMSASGYWGLYIGSILNGLAAGTVEAVINPAVASLYPKNKTKMLTILHAGWPGGFVLGGIAVLSLKALDIGWHINVGIILIPTIIYGLMILKAKFPVSERVAAGIPFKGMLKEAGTIGWLVVIYFLAMEINRVLGLGSILDTRFFDLPSWPMTIIMAALVGGFLLYTRSFGRPMYIFLLLLMIIVATTELGTDTWIKELMSPAMSKIGLDGGWVLVYTATIMTILRFCIGPIERLLRPLGVLFCSSILAALGLYLLSSAEGAWILVWATLYGVGQCFFWPVTLGLVAEQFPRGGALTLNAIAGVGMLGVGILGSQLLGFWQDIRIDESLKNNPSAYTRLMSQEEQVSIFGNYRPLNSQKVNEINDKVYLYDFKETFTQDNSLTETSYTDINSIMASSTEYDDEYKYFKNLVRNAFDHHVRKPDNGSDISTSEMLIALKGSGLLVTAADYKDVANDRNILGEATSNAKRFAMKSVTFLPIIMALCYLGLIIYFRVARGGYTVVDINEDGEITGSHKPSIEEMIEHSTSVPGE